MRRLTKTRANKTKLVIFSTLFFLALNFLVLFRHREPPSSNAPPPTLPHLKPWPELPSLFPWSHKTNLRHGDCESYFGNGFNRRIDALRRSSNESSSWFRCFYNDAWRSSVCEVGGLWVMPQKIRMSRGGEEIHEVMGRREEEELPLFGDGSVKLVGVGGLKGKLVDEAFLNRVLPSRNLESHPMRSLVGMIEMDDTGCDQWVMEPTLLVTRYEYANLFHTMTDWHSAYVASRVTNLPYRPHLVFIDGHCESPLDPTWDALFSSVRYIKSFSGSVCFRHAVLVPLGYETPLFRGLTQDISCEGTTASDLSLKPNNHKTARLSEFGEMIKAAFGLPLNYRLPLGPNFTRNILFVRREDYLAHPRHHGKVESRLSNEEEVFVYLQKWVPDYPGCKLNLVNGLFAHMPMVEQIRSIQEASVIIGAHGAGLTHIVSATHGTVILEIISAYFRRPHFELISKWKGLEYHAIQLAGSHAEPDIVVEKLRGILKSHGC